MEDLSIDQQVNLKAVTPPFWIVDNYHSILYTVDSGLFCQWNLDSGFQSLERSGLSYIPDSTRKKLPRFRISRAKTLRIPESRFPYMRRTISVVDPVEGPAPCSLLIFFWRPGPPYLRPPLPHPPYLKDWMRHCICLMKTGKKIVDADLEGFHCLTNVLLIN